MATKRSGKLSDKQRDFGHCMYELGMSRGDPDEFAQMTRFVPPDREIDGVDDALAFCVNVKRRRGSMND